MQIILFIKTLLDCRSYFRDLYKWARKRKLLTIQFAFIFLGLVASSFLAAREYLKNKEPEFSRATRSIAITQEIDKYLKSCGDHTSITISVVSKNMVDNLDYYGGFYEFARACDYAVSKDCIVNLRDLNIYRERKRIDLSSFNKLKEISNSNLPEWFSLRVDGEQNLFSVERYPSFLQLLKETYWHKNGLLDSLWITSIVRNDNVIYVITLLSASTLRSCANQENIILLNLKNFLLEYDK